MNPIFLTGYMACGKSTLARAVSRATGLTLIDLDTYIENRFHTSVAQIFANEGEARFREIESRMLREVGEFEDVIVACGGGTPCFGDNMDYMNSRGLTVWLDASAERIVERLLVARRKRPLVDGLTHDQLRDAVVEGLARREPFYSKAAIRFGSDQLDNRAQLTASTALFIEATGLAPNTSTDPRP